MPEVDTAAGRAVAYAALAPGDPAPWFRQASTSNPDYAFDSVAGRYVVLCFFGSAADALAQAAVGAVLAERARFDDVNLCCFGVSVDRGDQARLKESLPGVRFFWDFDLKVSKLYGVAPQVAEAGARVALRRKWLVLDPMLRVLQTFPLERHDALFAYLASLPKPSEFAGFEIQAPILILPRVFEPELCRHLIELYERNGGAASGVMQEAEGKTVSVENRSFKVRKDYILSDDGLIQQLRARILRRVVPEVQRIHQFKATRMERYLVACYAAEDGGHFAPHRDNTTKGTAHRRFAVSVNLNDGFEGGGVSFPEYGPRGYKPPPGGAVVFSCAMLHAVAPVTSGHRYAFLPFLYDEEAARLREANNQFLGEGVGAYKS
jgi:peroxiredoxin/predicted 2-oxoglutarate/Fe(II)-dependent dioxygenase YbiX